MLQTADIQLCTLKAAFAVLLFIAIEPFFLLKVRIDTRAQFLEKT